MPIMIYPEKMDPAAVSAHAAEIANVKNPMLASLCLITGSTLGGSKGISDFDHQCERCGQAGIR